MNVYVVELARRVAARGIDVEIMTRATSSEHPPIVEVSPGVVVRHLVAGPFEGLAKQDLPAQLCDFARELLRASAADGLDWFDLIHAHYWLSGQAAALATQRLRLPLVHSMHTMARVKNAALAEGDRPEPVDRILGEDQVAETADRLIANSHDEAEQLVRLYGADADKVAIVHPGVDLALFTPGSQAQARRRLGVSAHAELMLFVGRIQPLKAPDVLVRAVARLVEHDPGLRERLVLAVVGGPSGAGTSEPAWLTRLADELGVADNIRIVPAVPQSELVWWYRAATVVAVPSYSESFGLVALEAQASGTPVVAAATGGLRTAVADQTSGLLVEGHDPRAWAAALRAVLVDPTRREALAAGGVAHAASFGWDAMADRMLGVYADAIAAKATAGSRVACR